MHIAVLSTAKNLSLSAIWIGKLLKLKILLKMLKLKKPLDKIWLIYKSNHYLLSIQSTGKPLLMQLQQS